MKEYGFTPADILLPTGDFSKWAVVACDQFTSEKDYWEKVELTVENAPSTLRITLPEAYLGKDDDKLIENINKNMIKYINEGVLKEYKNKFVYVERVQSDGSVRHGIVGKIKLSDYDYRKGSKALIRATEETVIERIPPRVKIRKDASLELPHVLLLADDRKGLLIEPLSYKKDKFQKIYDFTLMMNGGKITGWLVDDDTALEIEEAAYTLAESGEDKLMFAVGDGNHSLATAKECSNLCNSEKAKYALCEVVNIHDEAIRFEPIYRVLFGVNEEQIDEIKSALGAGYNGADAQKITFVFDGSEEEFSVKPTSKLPVGTLQNVLDAFVKQTGVKIDYIHGEDVVRKLCKEKNTVGFIFDGMRKDELFDAVRQDGSLPRKTFSMGHASDKRYYIEARKIK